MQRNTNLENITRAVHWASAILVIFLIAIGFYMANTQTYSLYPLHKSFGVIAFIVVLFRLVWRQIHTWRSSATGLSTYKQVKFFHAILLILFLMMPVTGFFLSGLGGHGIRLFGLTLVQSQYDVEGNAIPYHQDLSEFGYIAHEILAYAFVTALSIHIFAALKHHFLDGDNTLTRMLDFRNSNQSV